MEKEKDNYFHCEGNCGFKSHKRRHLIYFKGKSVCRHCMNKASKVLTYVPTSNPSMATLMSRTRLPEGKSMPRERWKDRIRVRPELKSWAEKQEKKYENIYLRKNGYIGVSLTFQEHTLLFSHFSKMGLNKKEVLNQIAKVKESIKLSHAEYKKGLRQNIPTFKEEFEKLIAQ